MIFDDYLSIYYLKVYNTNRQKYRRCTDIV